MQLGTNVMVRQNVRVEKRSLRGMRGHVIDRPGEGGRPEIGLVFIYFPSTHLRDDFCAWVRETDLEILV